MHTTDTHNPLLQPLLASIPVHPQPVKKWLCWAKFHCTMKRCC